MSHFPSSLSVGVAIAIAIATVGRQDRQHRPHSGGHRLKLRVPRQRCGTAGRRTRLDRVGHRAQRTGELVNRGREAGRYLTRRDRRRQR